MPLAHSPMFFINWQTARLRDTAKWRKRPPCFSDSEWQPGFCDLQKAEELIPSRFLAVFYIFYYKASIGLHCIYGKVISKQLGPAEPLHAD